MAACPQTESRTETISYTEFLTDPGVAAKETDNCANYPPDDASVWDG